MLNVIFYFSVFSAMCMYGIITKQAQRRVRMVHVSVQNIADLEFFFRISSYLIVNSVCCRHALVSVPTSKSWQ